MYRRFKTKLLALNSLWTFEFFLSLLFESNYWIVYNKRLASVLRKQVYRASVPGPEKNYSWNLNKIAYTDTQFKF